ncbi:MAG: polysaccharide deacetylase family protein [Anaerolineales bacterium]|nr:polysaccharide deacetylase family protein [Chloroflexota bacterium]MBL6981730.1 polysaccharide deacetylase family protein [Anaerolineales bacterium]
MHPNPVLKKLGFSKDDRVVILHASDIGMSHASVVAFEELWDFGLISSGAAMVPCPWFYEVAAICRENYEMDMGVHLTLTSEWESYRWGPISTRDVGSGMIDFEGCFYRSFGEALEHGDPEAVLFELRAQVERAISLGVEPTHVDMHLGSLEHPNFMPGFLQLAVQYALPPMLLRRDEGDWQDYGLEPDTAKLAALMIAQTEEMGVPLLDHFVGLALDQDATLKQHNAHVKQSFEDLKPGVTHYVIHPALDSRELRAMTPDWPSRVADTQAFTSDNLRVYIQKSGIQVIGYRALKELMPSLS